MDGETYKKSKGNAGLDGVQFQLDLLIVFLLNALRNHKDWKISSENQEAGKYDDLVLELPNRSIFLQSKFKQTKKITRDQLFSCNSKTADFSLPKYFFSYLEIKSDFREKSVIICTNGELNPKGLVNALVHHNVGGDSLLHCEGATCSLFTFNEDILTELKASAEIYFDKNLQAKGIDKAVITDKHLKEFLNKLQFFCNYPSGDKLHKIIERLLSRLGDPWCKTSHHEIYRKVEDWFKQPKGEYLTEFRSNAMLCEIRSDKYCEWLKDFNVSFDSNDLDIEKSKGIIHVKVGQGFLTQVLKIYCALQSAESRKLYVNPEYTTEMLKQAVEAFSLRRYTFLIMVWAAIEDETAKREIVSKVRNILKRDSYKKVILVAGDEVNLEQQFGLEVCQIDGFVTFQDFSKNTQERLLKTHNVLFQGYRTSLEELLKTQAAEDCTAPLHSTMLERLVRREEVTVGVLPLDLDEDTARYYLPRAFVVDDELLGLRNILTEEKLYGVKEKVIVISESAGMGKSTVLTKMTAIIKKNNHHLWVIKVNLNDYTKVLRDFVKIKQEEITAKELLNSQVATKMTNEFEKFIFSINEKVVLMLDGVDEISPDYTDLVLSLLRHCQQAPNFAKIFVTTRPHVDLKLEDVSLTRLVHLTKLEQRDFLTEYWVYNLRLSHKDRDRCKQYATILIEKISSWAVSSAFTDNPLQVRMLAEIFQENIKREENADWEGCKEFLERDDDEPKLPEKYNIAKLYDTFIEKKRDVFIDKGSPSGNAMATPALLNQFESCLAYHRSLAVSTLLPEYIQLFKTQLPEDKDTEEYILKIGIVQRIRNHIHFIHRTFTEYFLANCIVQELKLQNPDANFQRLLIDTILCTDEFEKVRAFLDILLQKIPLPSNVFKQYRSHKYESNPNLIFELAHEGHVAIFRLILESVRFRVIQRRNIINKDWWMRLPFRKSNTLNDLAVLLGKEGVNIKCGDGGALLHYAVKGGHLEMVDFLFQQGANINVKDNESRTPLYLATYRTNWNIIKCLVEHGADVNVKDDWGFTALHRVIVLGTLDIVGNLLIHGADINLKDSENDAALNSATSRKNWNIVNYLAEHGADVNSKDIIGFTILHHAIVLGTLDVIACLVDHGADITIDNIQGLTALHVAAKLNKIEIVEYFLKHGADVNVKDFENRTALHLATYWNHLRIVECLIKHGADVNIMDVTGRTALHYAFEENMWDIIDYLVLHDASIL